MIIVAYITENFIRETLKDDEEKLSLFLGSLFKRKEHLFFIFEPGLDFLSIKRNLPNEITQNNITCWSKYIRLLIKSGRLKEYSFIKENFSQNNLEDNFYKGEFIKKSFLEKVFYLSFKKFYIKKPFSSIESLGNNLEQIMYKIEGLLQDNIKPVKNIKDSYDREKLFFNKLGGFCCFYNTIICLDRYILNTHKENKNIYLKTITRLLNGSSIKNIIIITIDPHIENPKLRFSKKHKNSFDCINDYLNEIRKATYPSNLNIHLFITIPEELKKIHTRYIAWAELPDEQDISDFNNLNDQIRVSIQPDKGVGYFEEDSVNGNAAKFNYSTKDEVNEYIKDLNLSDPEKYEDSFKYWNRKNYPNDRVWIHHNEFFIRTKIKKNKV